MAGVGQILEKKGHQPPRSGLGYGVRVRVWIWINCRPITIQYFIAYNGITTPIDYRLQREERLSYEMSIQNLQFGLYISSSHS